MKLPFLIVLILILCIAGWIYSSRSTLFDTDGEDASFTGVRLLPTMQDGSDEVIDTASWTIDLRDSEEKKARLREFILQKEEELKSKTLLTDREFSQFLIDTLVFIDVNPGLRELIRLPYQDMRLNMEHVLEHIPRRKAKEDGTTAQIIAWIYSFETPPKKYSQKECFDFLNSQNDLWEFFKDLSQLTFSGYIASPLFQRDLSGVTLDDLYTPEGINGKGSDENDWRDIEARVNLLLISDFLFFQRAESMTLDGIANSLQCELSVEKDQEMCFALEKALRNKDKEFILKKFANNSRKYDLDSYYIRYLIEDLDKTWFINKVCLIK
jgi:hypothetical protein